MRQEKEAYLCLSLNTLETRQCGLVPLLSFSLGLFGSIIGLYLLVAYVGVGGGAPAREDTGAVGSLV